MWFELSAPSTGVWIAYVGAIGFLLVVGIVAVALCTDRKGSAVFDPSHDQKTQEEEEEEEEQEEKKEESDDDTNSQPEDNGIFIVPEELIKASKPIEKRQEDLVPMVEEIFSMHEAKKFSPHLRKKANRAQSWIYNPIPIPTAMVTPDGTRLNLNIPGSPDSTVVEVADEEDSSAPTSVVNGTSDSVPANSDSVPPNSDSVPPNSDSVPPNSDSVPPNSDSVPENSDAVPPNSDSSPASILRNAHKTSGKLHTKANPAQRWSKHQVPKPRPMTTCGVREVDINIAREDGEQIQDKFVVALPYSADIWITP